VSNEIVFVEGSPSPTSRSSQVARAIGAHLKEAGFSTRIFSLHDFEPADVLFGHAETPGAQSFLASVRDARAIVLSTPVYKATYAGGLKAIVDLLPPDSLTGRAALGIATTRSEAHGLEVARAYRSLFAFFSANVVGPLVVLDSELRVEGEKVSFLEPAKERVGAAARLLIETLDARVPSI
jgi:FMN reductase